MAEYFKLNVELRETKGGSSNQALRRIGKIPANYYYKEQDNVNLILDAKNLFQAIDSGHHIFEVQMDGNAQFVMLKEIQYHPVTDNIIHVDLMRVRRDVKMKISVPIHLEGKSVGVKEGGVLTHILTSLEIECLPQDVPDYIALDVTELAMNQSRTVADIKVGDAISIITDKKHVVAIVSPPKVEEEPTPAAEVVEETPLATAQEAAEGAEESSEESADKQ